MYESSSSDTTRSNDRTYRYNTNDSHSGVYYFKGKDEPLSNFFKTRIKVFNRQFTCSEGAYQYSKAVYHGKLDIAEELVYANSGIKAKAISHQVPTDPEWHELKEEAMRAIIAAKIEQCLPFRRFLLERPDTTLIEDTENDYWARGENLIYLLKSCIN